MTCPVAPPIDFPYLVVPCLVVRGGLGQQSLTSLSCSSFLAAKKCAMLEVSFFSIGLLDNLVQDEELDLNFLMSQVHNDSTHKTC